MRRIHIYKDGSIATVQSERDTPGLITIPFQSTPDGQVIAPVEELDGGTLAKKDWDRIHQHKDKKVLNRVKKNCRITYKRGLRPEIDEQRDTMFKDIISRARVQR